MKFLDYFMVLAMLLSVVNSYPVNMICVPACNPKIMASTEFVNGWLSHGIEQLQYRKGTVIEAALKNASIDVSHLVDEYS